MAPTTVLVVEDDTGIRTSLAAALRGDGHDVIAVADGTALDEHLADIDLAILDLALPHGPDGFEITRRIRAATELPIVILTAAGDLEHKGIGYRAGADLYVTKPFSVTELLWQVNALLRRSDRRRATVRAGAIEIDVNGREVRHGATTVTLTPAEFALLLALATHAGNVLSKPQLLRLVWGHDGFDPNVVETTVRRLRAKLAPHDPGAIETVRGFGYRIAG